jgi:predicted DNA-binding transcriptional regulator AlpA
VKPSNSLVAVPAVRPEGLLGPIEADLRRVAAEARAAGTLPALLGELERVRVEILLSPEAAAGASGVGEAPKPAPAPESPEELAVASGDRILSVAEVAAKLGRSTWYVRQNRGALPLVRLGGRRYGFSAKKLERWIERRTE